MILVKVSYYQPNVCFCHNIVAPNSCEFSQPEKCFSYNSLNLLLYYPWFHFFSIQFLFIIRFWLFISAICNFLSDTILIRSGYISESGVKMFGKRSFSPESFGSFFAWRIQTTAAWLYVGVS